MKNCSAPKHPAIRRILRMVGAAALAVACTLSLSASAHADKVKPTPVPAEIEVPEGHKAFLEGHAIGTQNYVCLPCPNPTTPAAMCPDASGFAWILFTPEATLFRDNDRQVITHFFSPNPFEHGTIRATWQHSGDTSTVWAKLFRPPFLDPPFVATGAIPWLLLQVSGAQDGPTGGNKLTATTFIHRVNTSGGVAPSTVCTSGIVGTEAFEPYSADYIFYTNVPGNDADDDKLGSSVLNP
jgi:hypothetical protein